MKVLLIVERSPYGSEGPHNGLRLADALLERCEWVDVFFIGEGVHGARAGPEPSGPPSRWRVRCAPCSAAVLR